MNTAECCLANVVVGMDDSHPASERLEGTMKELLCIGSPNEYLLQLCCEYEGLPDGAAKHLLSVTDDSTRHKFAELLRKYADVSPAQLPKQVPPARGVDDFHEVRL